MSRNAERSLFAGFGALAVVAAMHLAAHLCRKHILDL